MIAGFTVKVKAGPRTSVEVECVPTGVNTKTFTFSNGKTITDDEISKWIAKNLYESLATFADERLD